MLARYCNLGMVLFAALICNVLLSVVPYSIQEIKNANALQERSYPESAPPSPLGPIVKDPALKAEVVFTGLTYATDMAFLGPDDILVTEKDTGVIRRILNGVMLQKPLLDVNVANYGHRGMLGIAVSNKNTDNTLGNDSISIKDYDSAGILTPNISYTIP
jgi:glucose/arabinose dehydrogenase